MPRRRKGAKEREGRFYYKDGKEYANVKIRQYADEGMASPRRNEKKELKLVESSCSLLNVVEACQRGGMTVTVA
jgi:hypothetical protein